MKKYIVALDQGTTSSRAIIFNHNADIISVKSKAHKQIYSKPGWVEHDPEEIWNNQLEVLKAVINDAGIFPDEIACIGITNQRETVVAWNKNTGKPICNAIVWQCRRTSGTCSELKERGLQDIIQQKTGLIIDAYFSGTKIKWILENVAGARDMANRGELLVGTIDTWLIWNLTGGKAHVTDYSNASRTMLFNIHDLKWDEELLAELDIPHNILPKVVPSSGIILRVKLS
ncbi:MAG TPA: hypothetical protein GXX20_05185 [Clostridiaceae bacterium]|nr:hypothetical protein [Clostridiaceae bacterium]